MGRFPRRTRRPYLMPSTTLHPGWIPTRVRKRRSLRRSRRLLKALPCLSFRRWPVQEGWEECLTWEGWVEECLTWEAWVAWEVLLQMMIQLADPLLRRLTNLRQRIVMMIFGSMYGTILTS